MGTKYYELLGVSTEASTDEIDAAYRRRAQLLHPDRHGQAPAEVRHEAERAMRDLNEAYETLRDADRRAAYDSQGSPQGPEESVRRSRPRPPMDQECAWCASTPAKRIQLQQQIGLLLWRRKREFDATLCRNCGTAMASELTNKTLLTGWWGVISFFVNFLVIFENLGSWSEHRRLAEPTTPAEDVMVPMPWPAPKATPLWRRAGVWVAAFTLFTVGSIVSDFLEPASTGSSSSVTTTPSTSSSGSSVTTMSNETTIDDLEGMCLQYGPGGEYIDDVVACSQPHDARVLAVTSTPDGCPSRAPYYFVFPDGIVCVDA